MSTGIYVTTFVHGGYTPNDDELQIVVSTITNFLRKIKSSLSMGLHSPAHFSYTKFWHDA